MPEQAVLNPVNPNSEPVIQAQSKLKPYFSSENARLNALKGVQVRIANRQAKLKAEQEAKQAVLEQAKKQVIEQVKAEPDPFVSRSLMRCRQHLDKLYKKLDDTELTPAEIDKIVSAIARFSDIEQKFAMRPGPGTLKPAESAKQQTRASWLLGDPVETQQIPANDKLSLAQSPAEPGKSEQE